MVAGTFLQTNDLSQSFIVEVLKLLGVVYIFSKQITRAEICLSFYLHFNKQYYCINCSNVK